MYCSSCGKELASTDHVCPACGAVVPPPASGSAARDRKIYAGFWRRFAASFLDGLLLFIPIFIVAFLVAMAVGPSSESADMISNLASLLVSWLYFALFESSPMQATPGKMAVGIKVVGADGQRIGFGRAAGRVAGKLLSYLILGIGFMMIGWTRRKQALHDLMATCLVVSRSAAPEDVLDDSPGQTMDLTWGVILAGALIPGTAILGIIAAIAIPAYQDYLTRAKVAEVVMEMGEARARVERHYKATQQVPESLEAAGYGKPRSQYIGEMGLKPRAVMFVTFKGAGRQIDGKSLYQVPSAGAGGDISWACYVDDDFPMRYVPASCRKGIGTLK